MIPISPNQIIVQRGGGREGRKGEKGKEKSRPPSRLPGLCIVIQKIGGGERGKKKKKEKKRNSKDDVPPPFPQRKKKKREKRKNRTPPPANASWNASEFKREEGRGEKRKKGEEKGGGKGIRSFCPFLCIAGEGKRKKEWKGCRDGAALLLNLRRGREGEGGEGLIYTVRPDNPGEEKEGGRERGTEFGAKFSFFFSHPRSRARQKGGREKGGGRQSRGVELPYLLLEAVPLTLKKKGGGGGEGKKKKRRDEKGERGACIISSLVF